jgi:hypothetical protein
MERLKVLHVSVVQHDEVRDLLALLGASDEFEVHQVAFDEFNSVKWRTLGGYCAVVFGISDGYCGHCGPLSSQAGAALKRFVADGGGVLWTHDTLSVFGDQVEICGFWPGGGEQQVPMTVASVRVLRPEHQAVQWPNPLPTGSSILPKSANTTGSYSHPPIGLEAASAEIIIDHNTESSGAHNYYLTVHSYRNGRAVLQEIGHAEMDRNEQWETSLFVNLLYWVCSVDRSTIDHSDASKHLHPQPIVPRAVLGPFERLVLSASLAIAVAALLLHFLDAEYILGAIANLAISVIAGFIVWWVTGRHNA